MIYTTSLLRFIAELSDAQLREIGLNRTVLYSSLQEIENVLTFTLEAYAKEHCLKTHRNQNGLSGGSV